VSVPPPAAAPATFRNATPYPFCPGCGHTAILDRLDGALVRLGLDPRRLVLVTDIGCSGLSDQYFATQAFHGLHGRSLTYATGLKLARPELDVVVVMGDGGTGIGGAHLLAAARRNLDLTLLVFDNFNFGMTGGQHSGTTPAGAVTATTPGGHLERPLDLCATALAAGATWTWRGTCFDAGLDERIADAVRHPGFALLDIWEPCTAYFAPRNRLTKKAIGELMASLGFAAGLVRRPDAPEYGASMRAAAARAPAAGSSVAPRPIAAEFRSTLDRPFRLVLAGAAGGRVGSAARLLARAAVAAGLHAALRADYPVTVKTGYSVAELVLAPEPIDDLGGVAVDALVVLAPEGRRQAAAHLPELGAGARLFALSGIPDLPGGERYELLDPAAAPARVGRDGLGTAAAAAVALRLGLLPLDALRASAAAEGDPGLDAALDAAAALASPRA
jgi:pyruvate/2-oxoacid:ferredoxin oxidoreductase beta subunit